MNVVRIDESISPRRAATIARIVDAALAIVTEEGVAALTMQRLAGELGYAIGALYRYFASKDALLLAVQRRVLERLAEDLAAADERALQHLKRSRASAEAAALTRLLMAAQVYETLPSRRPAHFRLLSVWLGDPSPVVALEPASAAAPEVLALFARVPALLHAAVEVGALTPGAAQERAVVLFGALHGVLTLRKLARLPVLSPEGMAAALLRTLLSGWGAQEAHLTDAMRRAKRLAKEEER